ncbi:hypothetical protein PENSPDRAFT_653084 [Peniophora sp. CONT]|nr:hypothetical protein PENSPDRAFT_653084 [Peniophora sp. CONT]
MESKLKSLKVAELKELLAGVNITTPNRATKADLISKVLESQAAQDAYMTKYEPNSAPAAPAATAPEPAAPVEPEAEAELDADPEPTDATPTADADAATKQTTATPADTAPAAAPEPAEDAAAALAARKARAERFGIPFVEDPAAVLADTKSDRRGGRGARRGARGGGILPPPERPAKSDKPAAAKESKGKGGIEGKVPEDGEKLKTRAERFGIQGGLSAGEGKRDDKRKRKSPAVEEVDPEEAERRRKRAERFGTKPADAAAAAA